jgi:hypothetical protein
VAPEICRRNREGADLYKCVFSISSDGQTLVEGEKQRTFNNSQTCVTQTDCR